jgi:RNA polymerase-interacting CarD/CdnL/TRCF family regulator
MSNEAEAEPERKDVTVTVPTAKAVASANIPEVIVERVDQLERIVQVLERHDKQDRRQFWIAVSLSLIAIILAIIAMVVH